MRDAFVLGNWKRKNRANQPEGDREARGISSKYIRKVTENFDPYLYQTRNENR